MAHQPRMHALARPGIGHHPVAVVGAIDDGIVDDAGVFVEQHAVERATCCQRRHITGKDRAQEVGGASAGHVDHAHVRHIEHANALSHGVVFGELRAIVQGHGPAGERHHARAARNVLVVKRCAERFRHCMPLARIIHECPTAADDPLAVAVQYSRVLRTRSLRPPRHSAQLCLRALRARWKFRSRETSRPDALIPPLRAPSHSGVSSSSLRALMNNPGWISRSPRLPVPRRPSPRARVAP